MILRTDQPTRKAPTRKAGGSAPDVIVLGGGGILGEAWMSALLLGVAEAGGFDARECGGFIGTSAGSIVAASLAAGIELGRDLGHLPEQPANGSDSAFEATMEAARQSDARLRGLRRALWANGGLGGRAVSLGGAMVAPYAALTLKALTPGGAALRRAALNRVPAGRHSLAELGALVAKEKVSFEGGLRIAAVELESGRRVMFGAPGAPTVSVSAAVQASCAIPGVYRPVRVSGRTYVDGGAWSPTNMDAAELRRGDHLMCLNPTGSMWPTAGGVAGMVGALSQAIATGEALAVRHRGARATVVNPDRASAAAMGGQLMDPRRRGPVIEAGLAQGRRLAKSIPPARG